MIPRILIAVLVLQRSLLTAAVVSCPAGTPVGSIQFKVKRVGESIALPLRGINRIQEGDQILYSPVLRAKEKRPGKVAVVLAPASATKRQEESFVVLDPKPADKPAEWNAPFRSSLAVFVYGPNGLSPNKVRGFLSKDDELISQLADYAEKTAQTESLLQALAATSQETPSENLNAALQGFASNYGLNNKLDRTASTDQQTLALFRNLNPALSSYDPISPQGPQRLSQTTGLATIVAGMFFGSTVGLAAGGTAMALNMKTLLFPNAEFRSSYAQSASGEAVTLCGKREGVQGHTRLAYLWAQRIPDLGPPDVTIEGPSFLAAGQKSPVKVKVPENQWKVIDRARDWSLKTHEGQVPINVKPIADQHALELDLEKAKAAPGTYSLIGRWDWDKFAVKGDVVVRPISTFEKARLTPESQDRLLQHAGRQIVQIEGDDFEFVEKAALVRKGDKYNPPVTVPFSLPLGARQGPQDRLELQVDTAGLEAGPYSLLLVQQGGKTQAVDVQVLTEPPTIENMPLLVNSGETDQVITLRGQHLDRITAIKGGAAVFHLNASRSGGKERAVRIHLPEGLEQGSTLDLQMDAKDYAKPLLYPQGLRVVAPRPRILESKLSLPADLEISLKPGELPSGLYVSAILRAKRLAPGSAVELTCRNRTASSITAPVGSEKEGVKVQTFGADSVFLSFNPSIWPAGCIVTAVIDNGPDGRSEPFQIGRVMRVPRIENFKLTDEAAGDGAYVGVLTGHDLEMIDRTGWDSTHGTAVMGLPAAIAGEGQKQSLRVKLPWPSPSPHSPLFVCFRGEQDCRATTVKY